MSETTEAYPLDWPFGKPRTKNPQHLQGWLINLDIGHRTYAKGKQVKP